MVEQVAVNTVRIGEAEANRLVDIAYLHSMPCMIPLPPRQRGLGPAGQARRLPRPLDCTDLTEIAARLNLPDSRAARLVSTALTVVQRLPGTWAALRVGQLDMARVEVIAKHAGPLAEEHYRTALKAGCSPAAAEEAAKAIAGRLEEQILPRAVRQSTQGLGTSLTNAIIRLDPDFAERCRQDKTRDRYLSYRANPIDGTGELFARLTAAEGAAVYAVLHAYARLLRSQGDPRTLDQLRIDTLVHLITTGHHPDQQSDQPGRSGGKPSPKKHNPTTATSTRTSATSTPATGTPARASAGPRLKKTSNPSYRTNPTTSTSTSTGTGTGTGTSDQDGNTSNDDDTTDPTDFGGHGNLADLVDPVDHGDQADLGDQGDHGDQGGQVILIPEIDPATGDVPYDPDAPAGPDTCDCTTHQDVHDQHDPDHTDTEQHDADHQNADLADADLADHNHDADQANTERRGGERRDGGRRDGGRRDGEHAKDRNRRRATRSRRNPRTSRKKNHRTASTGRRARDRRPSRSAVAAHVNITVNLETLLELSEDPGVLEGHGPITPALARALAFAEGSTWRRLVTDPSTDNCSTTDERSTRRRPG